jgi:glycosyltransferase involved in cell wall biosynthesis
VNVKVSVEHRFLRTTDNVVWTQAAFDFRFWQRYLDVFNSVSVIARVQTCPNVPKDWIRADGHNVSFFDLPYYVGPSQYLRVANQVKRQLNKLSSSRDAIIFRIPSQIATLALSQISSQKRPFAVEVVGDPFDIFAPGAIRHPLRFLFRWHHVKEQKRECYQACAVAYVTKETLQQRYPAAQSSFSTNYSSIDLPEIAFTDTARCFKNQAQTLICVGSMEHYNKGLDVLLHALKLWKGSGGPMLTLVGDGKHRIELEALTAELGLSDRVRFAGQLAAGAAVRAQLDQADVFVLPSRTEGLPRAMIEAMARGLPCIGSTAGGIPELLPPEDMVPPNDAGALAQKIQEVVCSPARMTAMSARNLQVARSYHESILRARRIEFYTYVKDQTQAWMDQR